MKKNNSIYPFVKKTLFSFLCFFASFQTYAGACNSVCSPCDNYYNCRVSATKKTLLQVKYSDLTLLNLKPSAEKSVAATNTAITITQADYQNIAQNGNSWIDFRSFNSSFTMNIGTVNTSSPQTFTLPSNLLSNFINYSRLDFINESSIDPSLQIVGSDVAARKLFIDKDENAVYQYYHVDIAADGVYVLGTSYDLYDQSDDNFDEEVDYEFLDAPLALNDVVTSIKEEIDFDTDVCLIQEKEIKTVNGYGILVLPSGGTIDCLRMGIVREKRTRANGNDPFPVSPTSTINAIAFLTKYGHYFQADVSATSGVATLNNLTYRFVQATNTLEETNSVRINNDSKAVAINATDDFAHHSAILDIQSSNKGVLIPRVTQANRPANPADGLLIYQIDGTKGFYLYNGSVWERLLTDSPSQVSMKVETDQLLRKAVEETKSGKSTLNNGSVFVKFDQIQENFEDLMINIQPEGDCNGLYISKKTEGGFWVKELQKGRSNVRFSWKIN